MLNVLDNRISENQHKAHNYHSLNRILIKSRTYPLWIIKIRKVVMNLKTIDKKIQNKSGLGQYLLSATYSIS